MGRCADDQVSGRRKDAARRRFDRWAAGYERDRRSRFNARVQRDALAALELHSAGLLLDVGCGTGAAVREAAAVADRAVGADISPEMIRRAAELASGLPNVEFVVADSEALPVGCVNSARSRERAGFAGGTEFTHPTGAAVNP